MAWLVADQGAFYCYVIVCEESLTLDDGRRGWCASRLVPDLRHPTVALGALCHFLGKRANQRVNDSAARELYLGFTPGKSVK